MPTAVPAEEAVQLHNRLVELSTMDNFEAEARQVQWRLQQLVRKSPSDQKAAVALIMACLLAGDREEAARQADRVWIARFKLGQQVLVRFLGELSNLGMYDRVKSIYQETLSDTELRSPLFLETLAIAAVASGDISWLRELTGLCRSNGENVGAPFVEAIEKSGLEAHFAAHQSIVSAIMRDHQCGVWVGISVDPDEPDDFANLFTYFFVPKTRDFRRGLEKSVSRALEAYYVSKGLPPGVYIGHFHATVLSVPAFGR